MSRREVLHTRVGEMLDLIACQAIVNGAGPAPEKREWTFDEVMKLR